MPRRVRLDELMKAACRHGQAKPVNGSSSRRGEQRRRPAQAPSAAPKTRGISAPWGARPPERCSSCSSPPSRGKAVQDGAADLAHRSWLSAARESPCQAFSRPKAQGFHGARILW